jgi:aminopeptidase N
MITDADGSIEGWVRIASGGFVVSCPMGAMGWFPNNNTPSDKATFDFHITVPTTHTALGNGELVSRVDNGDGTTTWNWHMGFPMSTYLSTATVGLFDYTNTTSAATVGASGNPLEIYNAVESALSPAQKTTAAALINRQEAMINYIAAQTGVSYPFDSTGVVLFRASLGYLLEVQTKIHLSFEPVPAEWLAHEVAHQWYGDFIGPATWREVWFNEGWATWWEWYWDNQQNGNPTSVEQLFSTNYSSTVNFGRWNTPPANLPNASYLFSYFPVYERPGMMLEAYRQIVGNSAFFAFQRALAAEHGHGSISGTQFVALAKRVAQERSGFEGPYLTKLDQFFQQWLYGAGRPTLTPTTFFFQLPPRLTLRLTSASELELVWPQTSIQYVLQESGDLNGAVWTPVPLTPTATNSQYRITFAAPPGNRFYRLQSTNP